MSLGAKCAFLYGSMWGHLFVELPRQAPKSAGSQIMGKFEKAMYGTGDAPQIWADSPGEDVGFSVPAVLTFSVLWRALRRITILVHIDDPLFIGDYHELRCLFGGGGM